MSKEEFEKLREDLRSMGWNSYMTPIDRDIAGEFPCEDCGKFNMYGEGYRKGQSCDGYRCFAICPDCGNVVEF